MEPFTFDLNNMAFSQSWLQKYVFATKFAGVLLLAEGSIIFYKLGPLLLSRRDGLIFRCTRYSDIFVWILLEFPLVNVFIYAHAAKK